MRVLITGATGIAGRFIAAGLISEGHAVTQLGRHGGAHPWSLSEMRPGLPAADALVHCALHHLPGVYRGGEGGDPETFLRLNVEGSLALFAAARSAGIGRILLLSSRAVYGDHRRGQSLEEADDVAPESLYGKMKARLEAQLSGHPGHVSLRATGIYGRPPGASGHKWSGLFGDYLAGARIAPRAATELHGRDLAAAAGTLLTAPAEALGDGIFNASDLLLDRRDLLDGVRRRTGSAHPLPPADALPAPGIMATDRLRALGWRPGGLGRLNRFLDSEFSAEGDQSGSCHQTSGSQPIQSP